MLLEYIFIQTLGITERGKLGLGFPLIWYINWCQISDFVGGLIQERDSLGKKRKSREKEEEERKKL
jgi:hypothetical protein